MVNSSDRMIGLMVLSVEFGLRTTKPELEIHLRMARRQGWTEDELSEALMHLSGYIGLPSVREAMLVAKDVFAEMRQEK